MEGKKVLMAITTPVIRETKAFVKDTVDWIKTFKGKCELIALYAMDSSLSYSSGFKSPKKFYLSTALKERVITDIVEAEELMGEVKEIFAEEGIKTAIKIRMGDPVKEIINEARSSRANLILVRGKRRSFRKTALESMTDDLINKAPCPVVVISPKLKRLSEKIRSSIDAHYKKFSTYLEGNKVR
jgi:nucleotide-binding universal stress UspA family protein